MSKEEPEISSRELKLVAVRRLEAGKSIAALGRERGMSGQLTALRYKPPVEFEQQFASGRPAIPRTAARKPPVIDFRVSQKGSVQ